MATKFSPCKGSYVLNQFPSNVMFGMNGFHLSASGAIQGHHGPLVASDLNPRVTAKATCYHTIPCFNDPQEMQVTSKFSFSMFSTNPIWHL